MQKSACAATAALAARAREARPHRPSRKRYPAQRRPIASLSWLLTRGRVPVWVQGPSTGDLARNRRVPPLQMRAHLQPERDRGRQGCRGLSRSPSKERKCMRASSCAPARSEKSVEGDELVVPWCDRRSGIRSAITPARGLQTKRQVTGEVAVTFTGTPPLWKE